MPVGHVNKGGICVVRPVGNTVADSETLKVGLEGVVGGVLQVILVNIVGKVGHVDASVGLSGDEEVVVPVLGEFVVPLEDDGEVVLGTLFVVESAILEAVAVGIANTCRLLDVEQVGLFVP